MKKKKGLQGLTSNYVATNPSSGREQRTLCRACKDGTNNTERREPDTTGIHRGGCLKGGDHGQDSNPKEPATQTRGLPPVPSRTHTPMPPGRPLLNTVWKGDSSCAAIHTPKTGARRAGAAPWVYRAAPSQRAQASAPFPVSNTASESLAQGHCTALACVLLPLLLHTGTGLLTQRTAADPADAVAAAAAQNASNTLQR